MILINPKSNNPSPFKAIEPPIWCAMLAGEGDRIIDFEVDKYAEFNPGDEVTIVVMGNNPSVASTSKMPAAKRMLRELTRAKLGLGDIFITGLHPIAMGEQTFQMPPPCALVKIPRARWELLDMKKYRAHNWHCLHDLESRGHYASLYTSFGCPFDCDYCNIHTIYQGRAVYYRPPEEVIAEIGLLVNTYGVKNLKLCDELFTLNQDHVKSICSGIKDYNLNIWAYARLDSVDEDLLSVMKDAGINWLAYGFESVGDKKFIDSTERVIDMTRDAGINIIGNFMFGLPSDTEETMQASLAFAKKYLFEYVNFYVAYPYPGSRWYEETGPSLEWHEYNQYGNNRMVFRDEAFIDYFTYPPYLEMIGAKFGSQAVSHIQEMVG